MGIHITFTDGSNPYVRYRLTQKRFAMEIGRWSKTFHLRKLRVVSDIAYYEATPIPPKPIEPFATEADA